jgi:glyoxylase-like metal-dependent hydrolase (beta-lactamase superfamily II)
MRSLQVNDETWMLTTVVPIPMVGVLPVNGYVVRGAQPMLVDTGMSLERDDYVAAVQEIIDPSELRWLVVTHSDRDHVGALEQLLALAPEARVVTSFVTVGIMGVGPDPIPPERVLLVRDGSTVDVGDRTLTATRPPLFDNPGTLAFFDSKQDVLFSADFLGAPLGSPEGALADDVAAIPDGELADAQLLWGSVDSPWSHFVDDARFAESVLRFLEPRPATLLGTHVPPIRGDLDRYISTLAKLPSTTPFVAPDQAALEAFMAEMAQH